MPVGLVRASARLRRAPPARGGTSVRPMRFAQMRAGIIHIDVDVAGGERVEDDARSRARRGVARRGPCAAEPLLDQRGQHVLLGERLGADHVAPCARRSMAGQQRGQQDEHEAGAAERDAQAAVLGNAALHQRQQLIDHQRQRRRGDAAEQHEHPVLRLQAGEDVIAQAGLADWCRQRCRADHPDRRGADAGHDHRHRQRQFDVAQHLAGRCSRSRVRPRAASGRRR